MDYVKNDMIEKKLNNLMTNDRIEWKKKIDNLGIGQDAEDS